MLEIKNLVKTYKPKRGVPVAAVNGVSLKFPDKGMVFLLGKSGSGKSTMLNLLGGLDTYDSGEIIIKGTSSKDFKQKHFDSYRNTYIGFIFQEYNVLDEFSVGANIALALELQSEKATDEKINEILKEVDLDGFGQRKPNELSGGQKQRVAIARALVKNPKIIMADEPTGALDSNTGRQIFDTLKKLSENKLVIVVSHDRDFAEKYADRIIELADGKVISDVSYEQSETVEEEVDSGLSFDGNTVTVSGDYRLTEEDRLAINKYIEDLKNEKLNITLKTKKRSGRVSKNTDNSAIENSDTESFKLIKSKLPMKNAFKLGVSGLKHKKFRLIITVLLSVIAFSLFGLADTIGAYNHFQTSTNSIIDSKINYAAFERSLKYSYPYNTPWYMSHNSYLSKEDVAKIESDTGLSLTGVYVPSFSLDFTRIFADKNVNFEGDEFILYAKSFSGFAEVTDDYLKEMGFSLAFGRLPNGDKNEIAVSKYLCETFIKTGVISSCEKIVGEKINLNDTDYEITGVIDTGFELSRYESLKGEKNDGNIIDEVVSYVTASELRYKQTYGLNSAAFVGVGFTDRISESGISLKSTDDNQFNIRKLGMYSDVYMNFANYGVLNDIPSESIKWFGEAKSELGDNDLIISKNLIDDYGEYQDWDTSKIFSSSSALNYSADYYNPVGEYREFELSGNIVGYIDTDEYPEYGNALIVGKKLSDEFSKYDNNGIYSYAVGRMPEDEASVRKLVEYGDTTETDAPVVLSLENEVMSQTTGMKQSLEFVGNLFFWVGLGFALFAALMLSNFISTSISYKKQEIGILRAIGSRGHDVFRIFFSESFVIAMINFVFSVIGTAAAASLINYLIRRGGSVLLITFLSFSIRQVVLLLAVSLLVAFIASYLPVWKIASKKPIDAIRNK